MTVDNDVTKKGLTHFYHSLLFLQNALLSYKALTYANVFILRYFMIRYFQEVISMAACKIDIVKLFCH